MATFQVNGSMINALTRAGIPALRNYAVQAGDRALGSTRTNDLGCYHITYDSAQLEELGMTRTADASAS